MNPKNAYSIVCTGAIIRKRETHHSPDGVPQGQAETPFCLHVLKQCVISATVTQVSACPSVQDRQSGRAQRIQSPNRLFPLYNSIHEKDLAGIYFSDKFPPPIPHFPIHKPSELMRLLPLSDLLRHFLNCWLTYLMIYDRLANTHPFIG